MGYCDNPAWERIRKRIADEVRTELRPASDRKLRAIVRAYDKLPFFYRHSRIHCDEELWYKRGLRYCTSRDLLLGKFSWSKLERQEAEEKKRKEQEEIYNQKLRKYANLELSELSLEEFERLKGFKYEFVRGATYYGLDQWSYNKNEKLVLLLINQGVEAFIRFSGDFGFRRGRGYPVRKVSNNDKS